jgi:molybdopterin-guanine dinucleotide biosynthesis protein A
MPEHDDRPDAVVLAGGRSRRMGQDKALLRLPDGRTALEAVIAVARQAAARVFLSVDSEEHGACLCKSLPWQPTMITDSAPDAGPLAALAGSLHAATAPAVLVLAVDTPLILPDVLRLHYQEWLEADHAPNGIAAPIINGVVQPLPACYAARLADIADRLLAAGERSLRALLQCPDAHLSRVGEEALRAADPSLRSFVGANTSAEWEALCAQAGEPSLRA